MPPATGNAGGSFRKRSAAWITRTIQGRGRFWRVCFQRVRAHNTGANSAALSYHTIFALIPTLVLAFLVLKAAGVVENSKRSLRQLLDSAGLTRTTVVIRGLKKPGESNPDRPSQPPQEINVSEKIQTLVEEVEAQLTFSRLGPIGIVLLVWSAVSLLTTMERSLDRIFEARKSRPLLSRVLLYLAIITFVPIILVSVEFLGSAATRAALNVPVLRSFVAALALISSLLVETVLLALVYKVMTNAQVAFRSALLGAAIVVPLWMAARYGFGIYLDTVFNTRSFYGALGLLPVFLLGINLLWYLVLLGAELAYTHANMGGLNLEDKAD